MTRLDIAGLSTTVIGPADAAATIVLLHGFGASGDDLVSLAEELDAPVRFVFPAAPLELGGLYGDSRAWWMLDLARLEQELRRGAAPDRSGEVPEGLAPARATMLRFLDALAARYSIPANRLALGGFSQGAMLSLDVALHRATPPPGLLLMSGTPIAEAEWKPRMPSLANVPVVLSHGRADQILPFHMAEVLRDRLAAAGARVSWHPFVGGHQIPGAVLAAGAAMLRDLASAVL